MIPLVIALGVIIVILLCLLAYSQSDQGLLRTNIELLESQLRLKERQYKEMKAMADESLILLKKIGQGL